MIIKLISLFFTLLIIANLFLFVFGKINTTSFWIINLVGFIFAYKIVPKINKKFK